MIYGLLHALDYWKQSERLQYPWQPAFKKCFSRREKEERKKNRLGREKKKQRGRAADRFNDTNYSAVARTALTADGLHRRRIQSVALLSLFLFLNAPKKGFLATREIQVF